MPRKASPILSKDSLAGLGVLAISGAFCLGALTHDLGRLARMQAGYFPLITGIVGVLLGVALVAAGLLRTSETADRPALRSVLFLGAAFVVFSFMIDWAGLLPAVVACGTVSALADPRTRLYEALLLSCGLAVGCWLLFIVLLAMPITAIAGL